MRRAGCKHSSSSAGAAAPRAVWRADDAADASVAGGDQQLAAEARALAETDNIVDE